MPNFLDKKEYVLFFENLQLYLRLWLKLKNKTLHIRIKSFTMVKTIYWIQHKKKNKSAKNRDKNGKSLYRLIHNTKHGKAIKNLRNRRDVKLASNKKDYLKCTSKSSYMSHKILDKNFVTIRKRKVILTVSKPADIGMCILDLSRILIYKFHFIKNKYHNNSNFLFTDINSFIYEI